MTSTLGDRLRQSVRLVICPAVVVWAVLTAPAIRAQSEAADAAMAWRDGVLVVDGAAPGTVTRIVCLINARKFDEALNQIATRQLTAVEFRVVTRFALAPMALAEATTP